MASIGLDPAFRDRGHHLQDWLLTVERLVLSSHGR
jgi:hypothetical protein